MSIRTNPFVVGEHYHIYNRGNSKQKIFLNQKDFQRFVDLLYAVNTDEKFNFADSLKGIPVYQRERESPLVAIAAYCLMPNHFHILLTPLVENGISKFMQKLSTGYVMYFNQKYKRTGALFEGKFKSQYVKDDKQLKYLFSYIHLNPVKLIQKDWKEKGIKNKKELLEHLANYKFSTYQDYMSFERPQKIILNKKPFPDYFPKRRDFLKEIFDWIRYDETL